MTDQIPPKPDPSQFFYPLSADPTAAFAHARYAQSLEAWGRDLAARLTASNALCAELAEALEGAVKELGEVIKSAESEAVHFDGDDFHERLTAGMKALAKFKEATR